MKLRQIASNMTEVLVNGYTVLFSYETPVAALTPQGWVRTSHKWSQTTTRHINKWLAEHGPKGGVKAVEMPQDFFDSIIEEGPRAPEEN
jgi:hypothetical protein